jgi:hypothetical protein
VGREIVAMKTISVGLKLKRAQSAEFTKELLAVIALARDASIVPNELRPLAVPRFIFNNCE